MSRMRFYLTHAIPRVHWTTYTETATGARRMAVWRQWGTCCWAVTDRTLA